MRESYHLYLVWYQKLSAEKFLPRSGAAIAMLYLLKLRACDCEEVKINKSALINGVPDELGSLSRKRYILDYLIFVGALEIGPGNKKSEKIVRLSKRAREILDGVLLV